MQSSRFDLLEAFGLDSQIITILKDKYGPELLLNPTDRQISGHKRKILTQIKKALNPPPNPNELRNLIKTRRKVVYVLNMK